MSNIIRKITFGNEIREIGKDTRGGIITRIDGWEEISFGITVDVYCTKAGLEFMFETIYSPQMIIEYEA